MNRWLFVGSVLFTSITLAVLAAGSRASGGLTSPVFKLAAGSPIEVGPMAGDPVIADCNRDGKPDIIVACGTCCGSPPSPLSGHVQILLGDGRGGFRAAAGSPIPVGPSARKVAVGDANGDGRLDLFVAQHDSYEVVALLGDGRGGFKPAPGSPFLSASGPQVHPRAHTHTITAGDVNADGQLDLLTTNANDNSISILLGDGAGRFTPAANSPLKAGRHPYDVIALKDLNGDGSPDLITPNLVGNAVTVMLNDGKAGFTKAAGSPFSLGTRPGYLTIADLNGDGKLDLAATHDDEPLVALLLGDGKGGFAPATTSPFLAAHPVWGVAAADVNGDRHNDLVFGSQLDQGLAVLLGDGKGGFTSSDSGTLAAGKRANYVAVGDLNLDGKPDIVGSSYGSGQIIIYLNKTNDVAVGEPAPRFEGRALDGAVVRLSDLKGKLVLLDFMASWCSVCAASFPEIQALSREYDQSKLAIVSVSLDGGETTDSTLKDLKSFLEGRRVTWPILFDDTGWDNDIARAYGVVSRLPKHVLIDHKGVVRWIGEGGDSQSWREARTMIQRLL